MSDVIRWGVLGAAKIADGYVVPAIRRSRSGAVAAIASRDPTRGAVMAARHDIAHCFASYEALINCQDVDAIYIALPTSEHFRWCLAGLEAGKHVLCEKPIAMQAREVAEIIAARDRTGLACGEAVMVASHPQWQYLATLLQSGQLGALRRVEGVFTYHNRDPLALKNILALGGGGVRDIGIYPIAVTRLVTGKEPTAVRAVVNYDPVFGTDCFALCELSFDGFEFSFYCGTQLARRQQMVFHCEHGWAQANAPFNPGAYAPASISIRLDTDGRIVEEHFDNVDQYQRMVENFADHVSDRQKPLAWPLEQSLGNQELVDRILGEPSL